MSGDVFAVLQQEAVASPKQFDRVEEVPIEHFLEHILPRTTDLQERLKFARIRFDELRKELTSDNHHGEIPR